MADSNDITLRIRVNNGELVRDLANSRAAVTDFSRRISQEFSNTRQQLLGLAGASSLFITGSNIIKMSDDYKSLNAKLKLVTESTEQLIDLQSKLTQIANANRQSLEASANLYSGIAPSLLKAGKSQEYILQVVDSVNKGLVVGGSTAQGSAAAILQLTQALGSGVLRGDEFNSIMENGAALRSCWLMRCTPTRASCGKWRNRAS